MQRPDRDRGPFVVLEGADGAGTTTQTQALAAWLKERGQRVHVTMEPSTGPIGRRIRALLQEPAPSELGARRLALLFAADRLDHYEREIAPNLAEGAWVLSDRYALSSLVYQGLSAPLEWVEALNRYAPAPDLVLVLDVPFEEAWIRQKRRAKAREVFEKEPLMREVCRRYRELAERTGAVLIDGTGSVSEVTERLAAALEAAELLGCAPTP